MLELIDVIEKRVSVRKYSDSPLREEMIDRILKVIQRAPSAGNLQAYQVYTVRDQLSRKKLVSAAGGQEFIAEAPVTFVFCAVPELSGIKYGERGRNLYSIQDATIACTFAMLAALDNGLGSVWVGAFDVQEVQNVLGCKKDIVPIAMLPIGISRETPGQSSRRKIEDINKFVG